MIGDFLNLGIVINGGGRLCGVYIFWDGDGFFGDGGGDDGDDDDDEDVNFVVLNVNVVLMVEVVGM